MDEKSVLVEQIDSVYIIYLNEPNKYNALTLTIRRELLDRLIEAENTPEIKSIIITGKGKGFSSGGDLRSLKDLTPLEGRKRLQNAHPLIMKIIEIEKPIIAAVHGVAAGAGFSLALLCDLIIASEKSSFIQSFVHIGLVPDFAAVHFLPQLIGMQRAKELMFLGDKISAKEAYRIGIVNRIVPDDRLIVEAVQIGGELANKAPIAIGLTKKMMNQHHNKDIKMLLETEAQFQELCYKSNDFLEGVQSFLEKRSSNFTGK